MVRIERLADDLILIDTHYRDTPGAIGAYLLLGERPGLVEVGPASTVETLLAGIRAAGLEPKELRTVAVTHIHLDHAGAAGTLAHRFPHLEVYVHHVGAPHLVDPSRLLTSAARLYGDVLRPLFGEVRPVPAARVHALADGEEIHLGSRRLIAVDTPGHARHHHAYHDPASGDLFTGDAAGVALPGSRYVRPPTPPPELDVAAWDVTLARLRALRARRLLLTHFGAHTWVDELLTQMGRRLHDAVVLVRAALEAGETDQGVSARLRAMVDAGLAATDGPDVSGRYEVIMATEQSAAGLIRYVRTQDRRAAPNA
jgi:glyoxylase-like metal-dependent hydrolase (beta-lactamase superfamily II)